MIKPSVASGYHNGQFLVAMPQMGDARFERTVIYLCAHTAEGAMGLVVNRALEDVRLPDLLRQLNIPDTASAEAIRVHFGGPVEPRRGFVIHSLDWGGQDTIDVAGRWALSATIDVLRAIAEGKGPYQWLVALGYAGWTDGQLDAEMTRHGWFSTHAGPELIFAQDAPLRWATAFAGAGIDPRLLASAAGTA